MIYQASIKLDIESRDIQVNFDLETGLIGFTENIDNQLNEYLFRESPIEFRKAFIEKFQHLFSEERHLNFKISRKNNK